MFLPTDDLACKRWIVDTMGAVPLPVVMAMIRGVLDFADWLICQERPHVTQFERIITT
jgi:hypothetical protein